jgi:cobalt/nickel transport system permease protein
MKITIDQYSHLNSWVHRWQTSLKLISLLALIFAFAFVKSLWLLPIISLITIFLYSSSKLPLDFLIQKLRYPGFFIIGVVIFLPFVSGETVIFSLGNWLTLKQEGCLSLVLIVTRFLCILTLSLVLFGTTPFVNNIKSLRSLGLSPILVDLILLSYRYLEEFATMLATMERAVKLRGFQNQGFKRRNLKILADLMGTLLVRSYEKSKRVYQAMILRGYGYSTTKPKFWKTELAEADAMSCIISLISLALAVSLIVIELLITF